jgi:ABC-type multidrug transport system permease subunit
VFASSVFVPVASMPSWLQPFAEHQPVSVVASAARSLMSGTPSDHYLPQALAWIVGIVAVAAPIAVRRYRRVF